MPLPTLQQFNAPLYQPATMKLQGMKMQDQLKRTGLAEQGLEIERGGLGIRKETLEFNKMQKSLEIGKQFLPSLPKEDWKKFKGWLDKIGAPGVDFLPDDVSGLDDNGFDALKEKIFVGADNITKMGLAQYKVAMDKLKEVSKQKAASALQTQKDKAAMERTRVTASKTETKEEKQKQKKLESLANDYFQQTGRGYSAERGTGQFIPDENKAAVAKKAYDSAMIIAQTYVDAGGKWEDLGLEDPNKKVDELPEGLTQIDIDHNMKKYNKTREEVIAKFLEGKK